MWKPQREALSGHQVHTPDLYWLGNSMDEWALAILDEFDGPFLACGASMGGYCALALARRAPERVAGLLLAGSRIEADSPERREGRAATIDLIRSGGAQALWKDMRPKLFPDDTPADAVERAQEIALDQDPDGLVAAVEAIRDRPDSTDVVAALDAPVVVTLGDRDPFLSVDETADYPGRTEVFTDTGHLPSLQRPERFNRVLLGLLESL
jgi:pimeloyl-ACP methyl ester carboxylesterase